MPDWRDALCMTSLDRPDYLPPPPREAAINGRAQCLRYGLLAGLLLAPPLALYLGQLSGETLERLARDGRTATATLVPRG
jgi:hypothetical protein